MDPIRTGLLMLQLANAHTYSTSPEALRKRVRDALIAQDLSTSAVDIGNGSYWSSLIAQISKGKHQVETKAKGLQFFYVKGGGEGFLPSYYEGKNADRVVFGGGVTTRGTTSATMIFDNNDALVVFDKQGQLLDAALLERPLSIAERNMWTEPTAQRILGAWHKRPVALYRNTNFDIHYYGLMIADSLGWYSSGRVRVDFHKQEATNGCIFIVDANTPPYADKTRLNVFEPRLIERIQQAVGAKTKSNIGTMYVLSV
jgi:hypothetical protein